MNGTDVGEGGALFRGADGGRLFADVHGPAGALEVFLFHGGGQTRRSWYDAARALGASGRRVYNIDQRGHGASDWNSRGNYDLLDFAADVTAVVDEAQGPAVLVGASLGGAAALLAAADRPEAIVGLVLVDVAPRLEAAGTDRIVRFMTAATRGFDDPRDAAHAIAEYKGVGRVRPHTVIDQLRQGEDGRWRFQWDPRLIQDDVEAAQERFHDLLVTAASRLRARTLLVRGGASDVLATSGVDHFLEMCPHATAEEVPGAGHMVATDRNQVFTAAILRFLDSLDLSGHP